MERPRLGGSPEKEDHVAQAETGPGNAGLASAATPAHDLHRGAPGLTVWPRLTLGLIVS